MFIWGLIGQQPGRHRFKKHLNCHLLNYEMGEACKGKNSKVTVSYMSKNYDWNLQEARVFSKY